MTKREQDGDERYLCCARHIDRPVGEAKLNEVDKESPECVTGMCHRDGMCHRELCGSIHLRASWRSSAPKAEAYFITREAISFVINAGSHASMSQESCDRAHFPLR